MRRSPGIKSCRDLIVWQKGIELVKHVHLLTKRFPESEKFGLTSQIRKAAASVPSNIAEGHARQYSKEFRQSLHIAWGSLAGLDTQLTMAERLGYMSDADLEAAQQQMAEMRTMISGSLAKLSSDL
jgi:four helix bundle protein